MSKSNLYTWGDDLVALLKDRGDTALVKIIKSKKYRAYTIKELPWSEMKKRPQRNQLPQGQGHDFENPCPTCATPNYVSGPECAGCGFKEWLAKDPSDMPGMERPEITEPADMPGETNGETYLPEV